MNMISIDVNELEWICLKSPLKMNWYWNQRIFFMSLWTIQVNNLSQLAFVCLFVFSSLYFFSLDFFALLSGFVYYIFDIFFYSVGLTWYDAWYINITEGSWVHMVVTVVVYNHTIIWLRDCKSVHSDLCHNILPKAYVSVAEAKPTNINLSCIPSSPLNIQI